ncbi:MAG TPA: XRE family transcriptional regulator [Puia sp.]|jgi:transcriptional regulator with XRE-family HTH domain|nr:XRE family transcriptional regulator [Puia sp.]
MNEELLLLIGDKIKTKRTLKNITLEQLAQKAGVSKGLISQIENNRTVPSLPVLFNIIHSLEENLPGFFEDMQQGSTKNHIVLVRAGEGRHFTKEPVKGFTYKRILTRSIATQATDVVLLELKKKASRREMIRTDAFECKYVLKGSVEYQIDKETVTLHEGDTLFFDGRAPHRLRNIGNGDAEILIFYFF